MSELFWLVNIDVTQAPEPFVSNPFDENALLEWHEPESMRTFLFDPINSNPPTSFGLELTLEKKVQITFFTKTQSQLEGFEIAQAWLSSLRYKFVGLDAEIEVKQLNQEEIKKRSINNFYEIKLPSGLTLKRISIIQKFINAFYHNSEQTIKLFIIWQKEQDPQNLERISNLFYIRIFIVFNLESQNSILLSKIKGLLRFLSLDILDNKKESAKIIKINDLTTVDLVRGDVFTKGSKERTTYIKEDFNFDFPEDTPLPKIPILYNENVRYIDLDEDFIKSSISVGNHFFLFLFQIFQRLNKYLNVRESSEIFKTYINLKLSDFEDEIINLIKSQNTNFVLEIEKLIPNLQNWYEFYCSRFSSNEELNDVLTQFEDIIFDQSAERFYLDLFTGFKGKLKDVILYHGFQQKKDAQSIQKFYKVLEILENYLTVLNHNILTKKERIIEAREKWKSWQIVIYIIFIPTSVFLSILALFFR